MRSLSLDPTQALPSEFFDDVMDTLGISSYLLPSPCQQDTYPFLGSETNWNSGRIFMFGCMYSWRNKKDIITF